MSCFSELNTQSRQELDLPNYVTKSVLKTRQALIRQILLNKLI